MSGSRKRPRPTIRSTISTNSGYETRKMTYLALAQERKVSLQQRENNISGMSLTARQAVNEILEEHGAPQDDGVPSFSIQDQEYVAEEGNDQWMEISHEGGEYQDLTAAFEETLCINQPKKHRYTTAGRRERTTQLQHHWDDQISALTDAYLEFKLTGDSLPASRIPTGATEAVTHQFDIVAIRTDSRRLQIISQKPEQLANAALLQVGFLGCSPVTPSAAIHVSTLELYYRLRRRHPRLSIQSMVKSLCDLHDVTYQVSFREQFSIAFDAYLAILRRIKSCMDVALGRDATNWRLKNSCPACHYELEGETPLIPRCLQACDGNNSVKRTASSGVQDIRSFTSDYFLTREKTDEYKNEVKPKSKKATAEDCSDEEDAAEDNDAPWIDGNDDLADRYTRIDPCTKNWKASAAEHKKRALDIYDITGIFASACRHGFILKVCEMVRSGELAKYPLALIDELLDAYGDDMGVGYDIGCSLDTTIQNSTMLSEKAARQHLQMIVAAFHAYKHGRLCQLKYHPMYRLGVGLEDLEVMERVFSASNAVASCVRYASRFHWLQFIDLHFMQWDDDKYAELSRFLLNNYKQALQIIAEYTPDVDKMKARLKVTDADIDGWLVEEEVFFKNLKDEPDERVMESAYVRALYNRQEAESNLVTLCQKAPRPPGMTDNKFVSTKKKLESSVRAAQDRFLLTINTVEELEHRLSNLGVDVPWSPTHPKLLETLGYINTRDFHRALDRVQQLVTQRLLELSKTHMSGTGYKMRTQIGKALQRRSKAIRTALDKYNKLALKMRPPAPTLAWKDVVTYSFVAEFELLKLSYSHQDITTLLWVSPVNREGAAKFHKVKRAKEELVRANIEIRRLATSIADERPRWLACIASTADTDPALSKQIHAVYATRQRVNAVHLGRLQTIARLPGFTGTIRCGTRLGGTLGDVQLPLDSLEPYLDDLDASGDEDFDIEMNDELNSDMAKLGDFLENLATEP